jgi:hypothetical protein
MARRFARMARRCCWDGSSLLSQLFAVSSCGRRRPCSFRKKRSKGKGMSRVSRAARAGGTDGGQQLLSPARLNSECCHADACRTRRLLYPKIHAPAPGVTHGSRCLGVGGQRMAISAAAPTPRKGLIKGLLLPHTTPRTRTGNAGHFGWLVR